MNYTVCEFQSEVTRASGRSQHKAGADGLNLPPGRYPVLSAPFRDEFRDVMRHQMRQPRRDPRRAKVRRAPIAADHRAGRSASGHRHSPRRSPPGSCPASGRPRAQATISGQRAGDGGAIRGAAGWAARSAVAAMTAGVTARFSALRVRSSLSSSNDRSLQWPRSPIQFATLIELAVRRQAVEVLLPTVRARNIDERLARQPLAVRQRHGDVD